MVIRISALLFQNIFIATMLGLLCLTLGCRKESSQPVKSGVQTRKSSDKQTQPTSASVEQLRKERIRLDQGVWSDEVAAQEYEHYFVQLWDRLRAANDKIQVLHDVELLEIRLPNLSGNRILELGIREFLFNDQYRSLDQPAWIETLLAIEQKGFRIVECEFHHARFRPGKTPSSEVSFVFHVLRQATTNSNSKNNVEQRAIVRGTLDVMWNSKLKPSRVEVSKLEILTRTGPPAFEHMFSLKRPTQGFASAHPILVYDLDRNGYPDIVVSRWNRVYWNQADGRFREDMFLENWVPLAESGALADVDSNGTPDFVTVDVQGRLLVFDGDKTGKFLTKGRVASEIKASSSLAMTVGDIDGDLDLDIWLSQYKPSYLEGQMPTPYYDANDGEPAYLLINDGSGNFKDETKLRMPDVKRRRRTYSSSLVDLDGDRDQDLMVVSDYAGLDIYENNGTGNFTDATNQLVDQRHSFGMAHTIADFDLDQQLDFYVIGMSSTTRATSRPIGSRPIGSSRYSPDASLDGLRQPHVLAVRRSFFGSKVCQPGCSNRLVVGRDVV